MPVDNLYTQRAESFVYSLLFSRVLTIERRIHYAFGLAIKGKVEEKKNRIIH